MISEKDKEYLLSLKPEDLDFKTLVSIFGDTVSTSNDIKHAKRARFATTDEMILNPSDYPVKEKTTTTVGRFIYNKYITERLDLFPVIGYVNHPLTDSAIGKLESVLSTALLQDKITVETFLKYIDCRDNLGMQLNSVITTSFTPNTIRIDPKIKQKRDKLFKEYDKELRDGDIVTAEKIEKELVADSKAALKGDLGLDLFDSEARGNYGNFKNMHIFKGATMNKATGRYDIVRSSFMDGISKEDIPSFGSAVVQGAYPKAVKLLYLVNLKPYKIIA